MQSEYQNLKFDYQHFFMSSQEMFCVLDFRGNLLQANPAFLMALGYSPDELRAKPLFELLHPEDRNNFSQMYQQGRYENRIFCSDGTYKYFSWSVIPAVEEEILFTLAHDITKQKKQELAASQAASHAYQLLDNFPDAVFVLDNDGCIRYLNKKAEEISLRNNTEIKNKKIWDIIPQTINSVLYKDYRKIINEQKELDFETFHPTRNQWYELRVSPVDEGIALYYHNITPRKLAESSLRMKEYVFNGNPSLMVIESIPERKVVDANGSFLNTLGYDREEVIGHTLKELEVFSPKTATELELLEEKGIIRNRKIDFMTKIGEKRSGLLSVEAFAIGDNQYLLKEINDLTEKIKTDKELTQSGRLRMISQVVAGIAHEIRNPMTTISGLLQMIAKKTEATPYKEYMDMIMVEFNRINLVIEDFLSFGRAVSDNMKMQNLASIIKDVNPLMLAYALESGKEIETNLNPVPDLPLDGSEIRTLILNLVCNGLEAMEGQGKLTIETNETGEGIVLSVRDTGSGIPEDVQDKVWMPFFTTKAKASGLGLARCYSIASRHAADIRIETGQEGTVVSVVFKKEMK